jgi:hypothetical protein
VANITLRRIRANDRTAPMPEEALEPRWFVGVGNYFF